MRRLRVGRFVLRQGSVAGSLRAANEKTPDGAVVMSKQRKLPARFPVGTRYIIEGERGTAGKLRVVSRYVLMPNGVRYDLMTPPKAARRARPIARPARVERTGPPSRLRHSEAP
jgi:hypothetical protein